MKNILEQLYAGELVPAELKIEGNEEYETLCRRSLKENEGKLHEIAKYLLDKETITGEEFMEIYERNDADVN